MRSLVLAGLGRMLYWVPLPEGPTAAVPWDRDVASAVARISRHGTDVVPHEVAERLTVESPDRRIVAIDPELAAAISHGTGRSVAVASLPEARRARGRLPPPRPDEEREFLRALARVRLEEGLRSPAEVLITLAREEERVERAVGRELRAAESFVASPDSPLASYAEEWSRTRASFERHHRALRARVETAARDLLPNLSALVGPVSAARLLSAAGSLASLGRLGAPRLQVLGARRRPSAERGPRYGILYRADRMDDVPLSRRGAYARSLAALAVIAARADATTRTSLAAWLTGRRDRRVDRLRRSAG